MYALCRMKLFTIELYPFVHFQWIRFFFLLLSFALSHIHGLFYRLIIAFVCNQIENCIHGVVEFLNLALPYFHRWTRQPIDNGLWFELHPMATHTHTHNIPPHSENVETKRKNRLHSIALNADSPIETVSSVKTTRTVEWVFDNHDK